MSEPSVSERVAEFERKRAQAKFEAWSARQEKVMMGVIVSIGISALAWNYWQGEIGRIEREKALAEQISELEWKNTSPAMKRYYERDVKWYKENGYAKGIPAPVKPDEEEEE